MGYVIKVKYGNALRRVTLPKNEGSDQCLPFAELESRIRQLLELPADANLALTYTDAENDVVTMGGDQDVRDALVHQALNPLRVFVALVDGKGGEADRKKAGSPAEDVAVPLQQLMRKLSATSDSVKTIVQSYEPMIDRVSSPGQAVNLVENVMRAVAGQVATAVKTGADAAAAAKPFAAFIGSASGGPAAPGAASRSSDAFNAAAAAAAAKDARAKEEANSAQVVHHAVGCDVCGANPIVGVRWKSNKKHDYDLCAACFAKHGKESDYTKFEQSMFRPRHLHGHHKMMCGGGPPFQPMGHPHFFGGRPFGGGMRGPFGPGGRHHCGVNMGGAAASGGKLDARFVCDVTMFDGTEVAPGTRFTKIWRLRNSGSLPWPAHTNLVHVGGDELGDASMVPLEVPPQGLAPEAEIEAAVDLVAPEKLGRYVSHWRLASPAGPKFGHRIWVVIQVVSKEGDAEVADRVEVDPAVQNPGFATLRFRETSSVSEGSESVPEAAEGGSKEVVSVPVAAEGGNKEVVPIPEVSETGSKDVLAESTIEPSSVGLERSQSFVQVEEPAEATESANNGVVATPNNGKTEEAKEMVLEPAVERELSDEFSLVNMAEEEFFPAPQQTVEDSQAGKIKYPVLEGAVEADKGPISYPKIEQVEEVPPVEAADQSTPKALLGKLQVMGFTNAKLNSELLEKNMLDLRKTLDDLCTVEEWENVLGELEEMGFSDSALNVRLMFANDGSIKRVVKELVQMYRSRQGTDE